MARKLKSEEALLSALMRFGDSAFRICYMHTKSPKAARDLLEDIFLQYILCNKTFKDDDAERLWVMKTAHKCCMDYYAAKLRRQPSDALIQEAGKNLDFSVTDELCKIMKLPYNHLTALTVFCGDGEDAAYAAKVSGCAASAVERYMQKAAEKTGLSAEDIKEWIQTVYMPDDIRTRVYYNITAAVKDKHFNINSRAKALKRNVDRAMPYVALGVICFCLLAVAAVRGGWLGVDYVRTPTDRGEASTGTTVTETSGDTGEKNTGSGEAIRADFVYYVPNGDGLLRYSENTEGDASVIIVKMAEKGAFSKDVVLKEVRFLKNGKLASSLKSGDMPDVQLYFSAALQTELDNGNGEVILEAISRTVCAFYDVANVTPAKLEIFSGDHPVTVNGEEVNCTVLLYGTLPVTDAE